MESLPDDCLVSIITIVFNEFDTIDILIKKDSNRPYYTYRLISKRFNYLIANRVTIPRLKLYIFPKIVDGKVISLMKTVFRRINHVDAMFIRKIRERDRLDIMIPFNSCTRWISISKYEKPFHDILIQIEIGSLKIK